MKKLITLAALLLCGGIAAFAFERLNELKALLQ